MVVFWIGVALTCVAPLGALAVALYVHRRVVKNYVPRTARIFQEKPLFIIPRGQPQPDGEEVNFRTSDGLSLRGCYLRARGERRGVILFGLEFGSDCWSCWSYCEHLIEAGFDVFAFEPRNQGKSDQMPGYEPLQWVTDYEVRDAQAALRYLKNRPDADPRGIGFFGISKGAGTGVLAGSTDPYVRCFVTDGMFGTATTMWPYMKLWFTTVVDRGFPQELIPSWYYPLVGRIAIRQVEVARKCHFADLESAVRKLTPRPLLMIHGGQDSYIKPDMARGLFDCARNPREFWLVEKAKHNQGLHVAGKEYQDRVLRFFEEHLASSKARKHHGAA